MPFAKGNKLGRGGTRPGAGRKPLQRKRAFDELLDKAVPEPRRVAILEMLARFGEAGNPMAAAFLFDRIYGKPVTLDISDALDEIAAFKACVLDVLDEVDDTIREQVIARLKERGIEPGPGGGGADSQAAVRGPRNPARNVRRPEDKDEG
jgi:hypothetical protein